MAELFQIREKYRSEIEDRKKTRWMIAIVVSILVVGIGIVIAVSYYYNNRCFNSCRVESQVQRNDSNSVSYRYFRGDFLKYSRNGISAVDSAGNLSKQEIEVDWFDMSATIDTVTDSWATVTAKLVDSNQNEVTEYLNGDG